MKAAILIPGQLRHLFNANVKKSIFSFLEENVTSFDFYCSFWDFNEIDKLRSEYSPIQVKSESWADWKQDNKVSIDKFMNNTDVPYNYAIGGILGQWYQIHKCFSLIKNPYEYDIIIRTRTDIVFPTFNIKNLNLDYVYVESPYLNDYGYKDMFFFSNPKNMEHITNLFPNIHTLKLLPNSTHPGRSYHHVLAEHVFRSRVDQKCNTKYLAYPKPPYPDDYFERIR